MRVIEQQLYKIKHHYGSDEFVEADNIDEVARYVGALNKAGNTVMSVTKINIDGTHPRVVINKLKAYKDSVK